MSKRLNGKVALIVGAGSIGEGWGNGRATAVVFAREGAELLAVDRDAEALEETRRLVAAEAGTIETHVGDVTRGPVVEAMVSACLERFGRIDILFNNVGGSAPGGPVEMEEAVWQRQFAHNIDYVFLTMKHVLPVMERQGGGSIINEASIAALAHYGPDVGAYAASKAGLIHFSRVTAVRYAASGIRINTLVPGLMHTPLVEKRLLQQQGDDVALDELIGRRHRQVPMGRMGDGFDVAYAALFLASDESRYVTGTELVVDGGLAATCRQPY